MTETRKSLEQLWSVRECGLCQKLGACKHRCVEEDIAWLEGATLRLARAQADHIVESPKLVDEQPWLPGFAPTEGSARVH